MGEKIRFRCDCGRRLRVSEERAGAEAICPACGRVVTIPAAPESMAGAASVAPPPPPPPQPPPPGHGPTAGPSASEPPSPPSSRAAVAPDEVPTDAVEEQPRGSLLWVVLLVAGVLLVVLLGAGGVVAYLVWQPRRAARTRLPVSAPAPVQEVPAEAPASPASEPHAAAPLAWSVVGVDVSRPALPGREGPLATLTLEFNDPRAARKLIEEDWEAKGGVVEEFHTQFSDGRLVGLLRIRLPAARPTVGRARVNSLLFRLRGQGDWYTLSSRSGIPVAVPVPGSASREEPTAAVPPVAPPPERDRPGPPIPVEGEPVRPSTPAPGRAEAASETQGACEVVSHMLWKGPRKGIAGQWVIVRIEFHGPLAGTAYELTAANWEAEGGWQVREFEPPSTGRRAVGVLWLLRPEDPNVTLSSLRFRLKGTDEWLTLSRKKKRARAETEPLVPMAPGGRFPTHEPAGPMPQRRGWRPGGYREPPAPGEYPRGAPPPGRIPAPGPAMPRRRGDSRLPGGPPARLDVRDGRAAIVSTSATWRDMSVAQLIAYVTEHLDPEAYPEARNVWNAGVHNYRIQPHPQVANVILRSCAEMALKERLPSDCRAALLELVRRLKAS